MRRSPSALRRSLPALALIGALLGAWEAYTDLSASNPVFLPSLHAVASALWSNAGLLAQDLAATAQVVGLGLALALALGLAAALAIHLWSPVRRAVYPLAVGSQAIPVAVLAPLLVFWWGFGVLPKLFVIVLVCFFPVVVTTVDGLAGVDPKQLALLHSLGASRGQLLRFAELPAALPAALSGARIAVAVGVIGADIAEISTAGTATGLGHQIQLDLSAVGAQTPRAWAGAVTLFVFAIVCFYLFGAAERALAPAGAPRRSRANRARVLAA